MARFGEDDVMVGDATGARPARRPRERGDHILDAADQLFRERGFHAVGIDDIGAAVGISGPAIYRHYASKEELLLAAVERSVGEMGAGVAEAVARGGTPEELLEAVIRTVAVANIEHRGLSLAYQREYRDLAPERRDRIEELSRPISRAWRDAILAVRPDLNKEQAMWVVRAVHGLLTTPSYLPPSTPRPLLEATLVGMGMAVIRHWRAADAAGAASAVGVTGRGATA